MSLLDKIFGDEVTKADLEKVKKDANDRIEGLVKHTDGLYMKIIDIANEWSALKEGWNELQKEFKGLREDILEKLLEGGTAPAPPTRWMLEQDVSIRNLQEECKKLNREINLLKVQVAINTFWDSVGGASICYICHGPSRKGSRIQKACCRESYAKKIKALLDSTLIYDPNIDELFLERLK